MISQGRRAVSLAFVDPWHQGRAHCVRDRLGQSFEHNRRSVCSKFEGQVLRRAIEYRTALEFNQENSREKCRFGITCYENVELQRGFVPTTHRVVQLVDDQLQWCGHGRTPLRDSPFLRFKLQTRVHL